jgi:hypothetical protein
MLELDVLILTDAQLDDEDGYVMADCDISTRTFLTIDNFGVYMDYDGLEYTSFYSGGMEYISMMRYVEFKAMMKKLMGKKEE